MATTADSTNTSQQTESPTNITDVKHDYKVDTGGSKVTPVQVPSESQNTINQVPFSPLTDTQASETGSIIEAQTPIHEQHDPQDESFSGSDMSKDDKRKQLIKDSRKDLSVLVQTLDNTPEPLDADSQIPSFSKTPLRAFSASESVPYETFKKSGGIRCIVLTFRKFSGSNDSLNSNVSTIIEYSVKVLLNFIIFDETNVLAEVLKCNVVHGIINCFGNNMNNKLSEGVKVDVIKLLRVLTQKTEHREEIRSNHNDLLRVIITELMKSEIEQEVEQKKNYRVLSHCCLLLSNLSFGSQEIKNEVAKLSALEYIAKSMLTFPNQQTMQARGCLAIRNLCFNCLENQKIAGESGAIESLMSAVRLHLNDREIIHQSCIALMNISNESCDNRQKIVANGGSNLFINLMTKYKDSMTIHDDCIAVIRNIVADNAKVQEEINKLNGIEIIIEAVKKFTKNEKLCLKSCAALRYLCFLQVNRTKISEVNGIEQMVQVLKQHRKNEQLIENALLAIGNATFENEKNKNDVGVSGGFLAIVNAIEQHRLKPNIQEHGCRVLRNLVADSKPNAELAVENGAITSAVFAMMGFADNPSVQEQACAMLLNLTECEGVVDKFRQADVSRLAQKAWNNHGRHRGVQLQAGLLIDKLNGYELITPNQEKGGRGGPVTMARKMSARGKAKIWPFGKSGKREAKK